MPGPLSDDSHLRGEYDRRFEAVQATFDYLGTDWDAFWAAGALDLIRDCHTPRAILAFLQAMLAWNEGFEHIALLNSARHTIEELRSELRAAGRSEDYIVARLADLVDTVRFFQESLDRFMSARRLCSLHDLGADLLTSDRIDETLELDFPLGYRRVHRSPSETGNDPDGSQLDDTDAQPPASLLTEREQEFLDTLMGADCPEADQNSTHVEEEVAADDGRVEGSDEGDSDGDKKADGGAPGNEKGT